jgi:4-hydroxybenzoate polyprenyltransferase
MGMISGWTIKRATGVGAVAAGAALLLWAIYAMFAGASFEKLLVFPLALALLVTAFCGLSVLFMTLVDVRNHRRGQRVRAVRTFDVAFGLLLVIPSIAELRTLAEWL